MPHIRLRGMSADQTEELSRSLPSSLAPILETTPDNFTIELVHTQFFSEGAKHPGYPFCEIFWFERSMDHRQRCADWLTQELRRITKATDVAVVFFPIERPDYFENGKHF